MNNDEVPDDVSWYCLVRWLSVSNVLDNFFRLLDSIKQFMKEKEKSFPEHHHPQRLLDLTFFDRCGSAFTNAKQGSEKLISDLTQSVFSFYSKLRLI